MARVTTATLTTAPWATYRLGRAGRRVRAAQWDTTSYATILPILDELRAHGYDWLVGDTIRPHTLRTADGMYGPGIYRHSATGQLVLRLRGTGYDRLVEPGEWIVMSCDDTQPHLVPHVCTDWKFHALYTIDKETT